MPFSLMHATITRLARHSKLLHATAIRHQRIPDDHPGDSDSPLQTQPATTENDEDDLSDVPLDYVPDDFDPDEATAEVWSGQDDITKQNLVACLSNIGIGSATDELAGQLRIRVTPESQKRAQQMIRQINEAAEGQ